MIPIKDKKYLINCQGPYDYNRYMGDGVFTGEVTDIADETCYGFIIPNEKEVCFFVEEEIVAELADKNEAKPQELPQPKESKNIIHDDLEASLAIVEEIGQYLVSDKVMCWMKGDSWGMFAGLVATKVLMVVEKELHKNGYEIRKIKDN